MSKIYKSGDLRGEKLTDGEDEWCCIWYPMPGVYVEEDEDSGICFDFQASDLTDLILLLHQLDGAKADEMDADG